MRAAQRPGGDPVRLVHAARRTQPRRLVLLCYAFVSGHSLAALEQVAAAVRGA